MSYEEVPKVLSLCHIVLCAMSLLLQQTMVRPAAIARFPMKRESGSLHLTMVLVGRRLSDRRVVFCNLGHGRTCEGGLRARPVSKDDDGEGSESVCTDEVNKGVNYKLRQHCFLRDDWTTEPQTTSFPDQRPLHLTIDRENL